MFLRDYIDWADQIDEYKESPSLADPNTWGYETLGKVKLPKIKITNATPGTEGYSSIRNPILVKWAQYTWPFLSFVDAKIQTQAPGQQCLPHLDFLNDYLKNVCAHNPELYDRKHSLQKPGVNVWRLFVAIEDQVPGQRFTINNKEWHWQEGDCIRLNNWQALHSTRNDSDTVRSIVKVTGIAL